MSLDMAHRERVDKNKRYDIIVNFISVIILSNNLDFMFK